MLNGWMEKGENSHISCIGLGIPPTAYTAGGLPAAGADVLRDLAGHVWLK